jgi:hypothetical protein
MALDPTLNGENMRFCTFAAPFQIQINRNLL